MTISSEPPSRTFPEETNPHCDLMPVAHAADSITPLSALLPSISTPLHQFERIYLNDTFEALYDAVKRRENSCCLVFTSADDDFPLGYATRESLRAELLGHAPDLLSRIIVPPCLPVSISVDEAIRLLSRKQAELGVLCDLDGTLIGLCTRSSLLNLDDDRL